MDGSVASLRLLFATRIVRMFAYGLLGVVLVLYLAEVGLDPARIGLLLTLTFLGDAGISLWLSTRADRWGRRRMLVAGAVLMVGGGWAMAATGDFTLLVVAATIGVISPTGNEVGPFLAVEQACLAQVVADRDRTRVFAWYNVAGYAATALGALVGGVLAQRLQTAGWSALASYRMLFVGYGALGSALGVLAAGLGPAVEAPPQRDTVSAGPVAALLGLHESRGLVLRLSALFSLDAFAGGFIVQSFLVYWFHRKFGVGEAALGAVFLGTNLLSGLSALAAVPLARRIGLVNTMVWTHLPSNVLLMLVPLMPTFGWAVGMLLLRHAISQMDVPTRQSYVNAVVPAAERAAANGVTGTARQFGVALAPLCAGPLLAAAALAGVPFFVSGGLKIVYDLALWRAFRRVTPPEERPAGESG
jgi:MFS family permease